jgi:hypothetical protein
LDCLVFAASHGGCKPAYSGVFATSTAFN